jgi:hypothetical protein
VIGAFVEEIGFFKVSSVNFRLYGLDCDVKNEYVNISVKLTVEISTVFSGDNQLSDETK